MPFKATMEIGGYKAGEVVPDEKALVWQKMYDVCPVEEIVESKPAKKPEEKKPKKGLFGRKGPSVMIDDYLDRNTNVVLYNIRKDNLDNETLKELLAHEKSEKGRRLVIKAIESKLEG